MAKSATINAADLKQLAQEHLDDAKALQAARRFAGAVYLAGYALECALKFQICNTLGWIDFPPGATTSGSSHKALKSHDLDFLLAYTGKLLEIKKRNFTYWQNVEQWNPEMRYESATVQGGDCSRFIDSIDLLIGVLI